MPRFDLSSPLGRLRTHLSFLWKDHAFLRLGFQNAHWVSSELVRTNQPWPYQLKWWRDHGVRSVLNLRGEPHKAHHVIEEAACERLGLPMTDFVIYSREAPTAAQVRGAKAIFETAQYPMLMHCKSGADRAGMMSLLYCHFRLGQPVSEAMAQLSKRHGHFREGMTGVLDYVVELYLADGEPRGMDFLQWVERPDYDPVKIKADFRANWWGKLLTDRVLRRE
ncbi:MAG: sulfur transferase domain-containing protein [Caulobacteraceae bacterium]